MRKKKPDSVGETPEQKASRLALGLLARREHSFLELSRKLTQRDIPDDIIQSTLESLQAEKLLSEERFVEQFVRSRIERGDGPMKIRSELAQRGIDSARAEQEIDQQDPDWPALAEAQRRKRFGVEIPAEFTERARQARFLQGRGFGMSEIQRALKGDIEDA
ncbi:MAG TPA: regulatory protein RecX [Gammaproteobacteria bacterium]